MEEIWTTEAKNTFKDNIEYLKNKWTLKEIDIFVTTSLEIINLLKMNPKMGQWDVNHNCYKFLVVPQIYLFYSFDKMQFVLLNFWNNYQKPLF